MPVDKNKLLRFQTLDRCFSDQVNKYFIEDLIKACNQALANSGCAARSISRSSVFTDIEEMTTNPEWPDAELIDRSKSTEGRHRYYRYKNPDFSIWKRDLDGYQLSQLQSILIMLRQLKDFPQIDAIEDIIEQFEEQYKFKIEDTESVISFESNENLDALSLVGTLFSHISHKNVLKIVYQPFQRPEMSYLIHPHFLKQYNRRWFLISLTILDNGMKGRSVFPLDRIKSIEQIAGEYIPSDLSLEDLFDDQIGVTLIKGEPKTIKLQFTANRFHYALTKPLHPSQRIIDRDNGIISINVKPNKELYQTLLSFGSDIKVIEPECVRDVLKEEISKMREAYNCPE